MKMRTVILIVAVTMSLAGASFAQVDTDKLVGSIGALKSYTYGNTGGVDLRWVEQQVAMAAKDRSIRGQVEQALIDTLAAATTNDAKQFLCRQLRTIGTAKCVPQLESMLTDPAISHMARYALGRIDEPQACEALRRALGKTSGKVKAGIINTLAQAGYGKALADFMKLIDDSDKTVSVAAIRATGQFPCNSSVAALQRARESAAPDVQIEIDDALLTSAEILVANGDTRRAAPIYEQFYRGGYSRQLRLAGLRGLSMARGERATDLLVEAIKGNDADLRRNAIGMMALIKGKKTTDTFVELSKSLPADGQELIIRALAIRGDVSATPSIIDMAASEHENVRLAAIEALGDIGTPQAVTHLAQAAARAGDREKQVARASIVRMEGEGIENALITQAGHGDAGARVETIRAIGQRISERPFAALHAIAKNDSEGSVRSEAILSMGRIGKPDKLNTLVKLAVAPKESGDRSAIERAVIIMFGKISDKEAQAAPILAALRTAPDEAKAVLLSLLTKPATPEAFAAVRGALTSSNREVSDAAIRALGEWPSAAPIEELYEIASTSTNQVHKVLALRGYVRLAPMTKDPTAVYVKAMRLASRPDEVRLVLGGLHFAGTLTALEMAEKYMTDEALKAEAYLAAAKVANVYCWQDPARARATLDKVIAEAPSDHIRNQARDVIQKMERYKGMIVAWKGAGPYVLQGVNHGETVFKTPFEPEENPDSDEIVWKVILPEFEGDRRINLEKTFGGIDYCCAYVRTIIHCPADREARIEWSVDDYVKGWLNGKAIEDHRIKLRKGENTFMLKVGDHGGGWSFRCQITSPEGSSIEGLKFEPR